jgi:hypothetical protein
MVSLDIRNPQHREILKRALKWESRQPGHQALSWDERAARLRGTLKLHPHTPSEILLRESRDDR